MASNKYAVWQRSITRKGVTPWSFCKGDLSKSDAVKLADRMRGVNGSETASWAVYVPDGHDPNKDEQ